MANDKKIRIHTAMRNLNVGQSTITDFLTKKGFEVENTPNFSLSQDMYGVLEKEFGGNKKPAPQKEQRTAAPEKKSTPKPKREESESITPNTPKVLGNIDLSQFDKKPKEQPTKVVEPKAVTKTVTAQKPAEIVAEKPAAKPEVKQTVKAVEKPAVKVVEKAVEKPIEKPVVKAVEKPVVATATKAAPKTETVAIDSERANKTYDERMANTGEVFRAGGDDKINTPKVLGTIDLSQFDKKKSDTSAGGAKSKKRTRIKKDNKVDINNPKNQNTQRQGGANGQGGNRPQGGANGQGGNRPQGGANGQGGNRPQGGANGQGGNRPQGGGYKGNNQNGGQRRGNAPRPNTKPVVAKAEVSDEDVQKQIKETLARLTSKSKKNRGAVHRKDKRDAFSAKMSQEQEQMAIEKQTLKVTEFVTVSDLAKMMDVNVTEVITACMNLGLMVSINQRLDAEALSVVAEEFSYKVEFVSVDIQESISTEVDKEEDLVPRPPIVTVMGHVDHGKTSLLDFIRKSNVIAGEAGGITQHIGAYNVKMEDGKHITFLDTPGHEAFTAMRARGASVTDVAIIIISADDSVMPQTKEAINHATAAGVPIVFAINKIDKAGANPDRIREQLGAMNYLVEDWGGKYQCQEISAKSGLNVEELLEKVLLEAEMLDLKANPDRKAEGVVIESSLDKGRGYVTTILVQKGTLKVGDVILSGTYTGRVKAMFNERGKKIKESGPSTPVLVLGLNGAPQAGDKFNIMDDDKQAREIANKREQLQRMQGLRTQKHITLEDIGHRIAIGNFQELNIIIKGDVDGSVEALTDSLLKESMEQVQVKVIHKAVGQISESDVLLAAASNALIIGFQVRPSNNARKLAEKEEIEIRHYSIIYDAINDIKSAVKGMLAPKFKEVITCSVEVMETFKITKVGTIAGCLVREGKIKKDSSIRIIRDGVVIYTGKLGSLKRYKDDAKEVVSGLECGLNIENFNDIKVGDFVEGYEQIEIAN